MNQTETFKKILGKKNLNPEEVIISPVAGDGNCFYRAIFLYLTNVETNYKIIREIVYEATKENKEILKPYFLNGISDDILEIYKLENYIEKIKIDSFYAGIIEISIAAKIFDKTIIIYSIEEKQTEKIQHKINTKNNSMQKKKNEEDNNRSFEILYEHMATVEKVNEEYENPEDLIILLYDSSIRHFSLIITNTKNSGESPKIKL